VLKNKSARSPTKPYADEKISLLCEASSQMSEYHETQFLEFKCVKAQ
jgi:hypothetical protein